MEFDVIIVGAGPAGLAAAIKLAQLAAEHNIEINICVIEKGAEVGAHILSGAVIEPVALNELLPNWQDLDPPAMTPVSQDEFLYLTKTKAKRLPTPPAMHNHGNYIVSLGNVCRWLAQYAENLGVNIFPGFPGSDFIINNDGRVEGVITRDMGVDKNGEQGPNFQAGVELRAPITLLAEGCRGSLTQQAIKQFKLDQDSQPQTYAIGLKELWEIDPSQHQLGKVTHTIGWPLDPKTYGGSFIYHAANNQLALGLVIGLDYENPYLSPFDELQRFKTHPAIKPLFEKGQRISYGARALNEGGFQSIPQLAFPGGMIVGCGAGFVNVPKIKGSHNAMKTGMLAAEAVFNALKEKTANTNKLIDYTPALKQSWVWRELKHVRNIRPAFRWGLWPGLIYSAFDTYVLRGHAPWTLSHHRDNEALKPAKQFQPISYPKPDGKISFDKLSSVYISNTVHEENQPCHLTLKDKTIPIDINLKTYAAPEQRYCPAGVYEIVEEDNQPKLQINAANCLHCKTCDIKDPTQNIVWTVPEGGGGPNYPNM